MEGPLTPERVVRFRITGYRVEARVPESDTDVAFAVSLFQNQFHRAQVFFHRDECGIPASSYNETTEVIHLHYHVSSWPGIYAILGGEGLIECSYGHTATSSTATSGSIYQSSPSRIGPSWPSLGEFLFPRRR